MLQDFMGFLPFYRILLKSHKNPVKSHENCENPVKSEGELLRGGGGVF